ncbi:MAG: hypothetical protein ONB55_21855 [candidate division KSB1 bacterium]|nr:hypothetical protein [candidate division KSB1 bacterium]
MSDYFQRAKSLKSGRPRKYRPGAVIRDIQEFLEWVYVERRWVYLRDKPLHPGFIKGMTLEVVLGGIIAGNFRKAELNVPRALPERTGADTGGIIQAELVRGNVVCFFPECAISRAHVNWKRGELQQVSNLAYRFEFAYLSHPEGGYSAVLDCNFPVMVIAREEVENGE